MCTHEFPQDQFLTQQIQIRMFTPFFPVLTYKIFFLHTYQSRLGGVFEEFSFGVQQPEGVMAFLVNET